jgi:hypothetical protein
MFKLLKLAFVVGALAAVWMLVPIGGRTLHARWTAAGGPEAFARAAWAELDKALAKEPAPKAKPGAGGREPAAARGARPTEAHSERDRQAVDKILAEALGN